MAERINKARTWWAVLYPENMIENWQEVIGDKLQLPYAYTLHCRDVDSKSEHRKDHVHVIIVFSNTTTYKHAMEVFEQLSAPGQKAVNTCEAVISIRSAYDYLIHDTETCRKAGKEQYGKEERITGNNFDIGAFEQLSVAERDAICKELSEAIREYRFTNFMDFYDYVMTEHCDDTYYFEVLQARSSFFNYLIKGNFNRMVFGRKPNWKNIAGVALDDDGE